MSKHDYAWFTIVNGAMATIGILADSGLGSAYTSLGGKTYSEPEQFSALTKLIRKTRVQFLAIASLATVPFAIWALSKNGATPSITLLLSAMIVLAAIPATDAVVSMTINKLFKRVRNIVVADLSLSCSRLALVGSLCLFEISAVVATFTLLIALWIQFIVLRHQTKHLLIETTETAETAETADQFKPKIQRTILSVFPTCIFTCFQGQLSVYVLTFFAAASQVAELGALMRLAIIFTLLSIPLAQIFIPAIARCQVREQLLKLIWRVIAWIVGAAFLTVAAAKLLSPYLLTLLGKKYSHLDTEFQVFLVVSALSFVGNSFWTIAFCRGWVKHGWVTIPLTIGIQCLVGPFLTFSNVTHVLWFSAMAHVASILVAAWLTATGYRNEFRNSPKLPETHENEETQISR